MCRAVEGVDCQRFPGDKIFSFVHSFCVLRIFRDLVASCFLLAGRFLTKPRALPPVPPSADLKTTARSALWFIDNDSPRSTSAPSGACYTFQVPSVTISPCLGSYLCQCLCGLPHIAGAFPFQNIVVSLLHFLTLLDCGERIWTKG